MAETPTTHLRHRPVQARSQARVELLLDVAAAVFEEVGYDSATTNLVAARAGVPVGTLYRWFPDKAALAEALTDRYLSGLMDLYQHLAAEISPEERIGDFLHRVISQLVDATREQRALPALLVSAMVPGGRSTAGERMRSGLQGHVRSLIEVRVPGIPAHLGDRTAEVVVTLAGLVIATAAADESPHRDELTAEYIDVMLAYLEAKFPSAEHASWTDPDVAVRPLFAAPDRASRLAALGDPAPT